MISLRGEGGVKDLKRKGGRGVALEEENIKTQRKELTYKEGSLVRLPPNRKRKKRLFQEDRVIWKKIVLSCCGVPGKTAKSVKSRELGKG